MINNENRRFDAWDKSFWERITNASCCYELSEEEKRSLESIERCLNQEAYQDRRTLLCHLSYLNSLINKLRNIRREENHICPNNVVLEFEISRVDLLSKRLIEKLENTKENQA
ncbi:hypothetical protein DRJ48_01345 [Candidatus Woesearchaeota archaeon]|nr:MAG: hypothetical protein DRJ48_01345 [Candidatus Woesearchaeota archaeon]